MFLQLLHTKNQSYQRPHHLCSKGVCGSMNFTKLKQEFTAIVWGSGMGSCTHNLPLEKQPISRSLQSSLHYCTNFMHIYENNFHSWTPITEVLFLSYVVKITSTQGWSTAKIVYYLILLHRLRIKGITTRLSTSNKRNWRNSKSSSRIISRTYLF